MGIMVICDDDKNIIGMIERQIQAIFRKKHVQIETVAFEHPAEALEYCTKYSCDFILLDIDMPDMTGFELTKRLQKLPAKKVPVIIFMSNQEDFVYEVFQYRPFDFLRKSCIAEELEQKMERLLREYAYNSATLKLASGEYGHVLLKEVYYFKSERNHVDAYTIDASYRCRDKISDMEEQYENCLIRTERSYLVNVNAISRIGASRITLKDGRMIPVSRRRREYVEERYKLLTRR